MRGVKHDCYGCIPPVAQCGTTHRWVRHSSAPQSSAGAAVAKYRTMQRWWSLNHHEKGWPNQFINSLHIEKHKPRSPWFAFTNLQIIICAYTVFAYHDRAFNNQLSVFRLFECLCGRKFQDASRVHIHIFIHRLGLGSTFQQWITWIRNTFCPRSLSWINLMIRAFTPGSFATWAN